MQPEVVTAASTEVTVGVPHASVAVAEPRAELISEAAGLQPRVVVLPVAVIEGGVISAVYVTDLDIVAVLPQPSVAVNVLVCKTLHPPLTLVIPVIASVTVLQLSVAVAVPKPASIVAALGLHPSGTVVYEPVNTGGVLSEVHETLREVVDVLPQASVAVNVLVCVKVQVEVEIAPSLCVIVGVPHASVAVALPNAVFIAPAVGLHPSVVLL